MWLHAHVGFWTLAFILFIVSYFFQKAGKTTASKIFQMILRLDFILVLITGVRLVSFYYSGHSYGWPSLKGLFGLLLIAMMELILTRGSKNKSTGSLWILLLIAIIGVFYIGYYVLG
ncbi:MAG: DUF1516 family protein [Tuberibacillus sp.]